MKYASSYCHFHFLFSLSVDCIPLHIDENLSGMVMFLVSKLRHFVSHCCHLLVLNCFSSCQEHQKNAHKRLKLCTDRAKKCLLVLRHGSEKCISPHFFFHEASDNYIDYAHQLHSAKLCLRSPHPEKPANKPAFCCSCMCRHLAVKQVFLYVESSFLPSSISALVAVEPTVSCFPTSQVQAVLEKLSVPLLH